MSTVDISRFAHGLPKLLAPAVQEGQVLYAFLEKENSLTIQADNVLKKSVSSSATSETSESQGQATVQKEGHFYVHYDMGTNSDGYVLTYPNALPPINPDAFDKNKLLAIVKAIELCLVKTVYTLEYVDENGQSHIYDSW